MKINSKILSLPPYVSTSWRDVQSVHQKDGDLVISLLNGESVRLSKLSPQLVDQIFKAHAAYLEEEAKEEEEANLTQQLSIAGNFSLENVGHMLQHNPAQANAPNLPPEMLLKIADVAKLILPEDPDQVPKAEPHCNCMHCQIARAIGGAVIEGTAGQVGSKEVVEDPVEDQELRFQQWDVVPAGHQLFNVVNRLDKQESYRVFLGNPLGCTCGRSDCEHLVAVLQS